MLQTKNNLYIPLSLYVHFPWCIKKCPYCDFNSHTLKTDLPEEKYVSALLEDMLQDVKTYAPQLKNRKLHSIFMGGGTPSLFSPRMIQKFIIELKNIIDFEKSDIEITLEANPGTVEQSKFKEFRDVGINRLSIGIQSFNPGHLKKLGRIHDEVGALQAVSAAKEAGFDNFNLDLMHGLPDQNNEQACRDIQTALQFLPPHLSWYQLTLEPNTLFYQNPPILPPENILEDIEENGLHLLKQSHYQHYEVSAYCQKNFECKHNINYWEFGDYLGIGAGAHGKITDTNSGNIIRILKTKHPKIYLAADIENKLFSQENVDENKKSFEFMLNALRLQKPISFELFEKRTYLSNHKIIPFLEKLSQQKLMHFNDLTFEPTKLGRKFLNRILECFL